MPLLLRSKNRRSMLYRLLYASFGFISWSVIVTSHHSAQAIVGDPGRGTPTAISQPLTASPVAGAMGTTSNHLEAGRYHYQAGQFMEAMARWEAAVAQYRQSGDTLNEALSLSYLSLAQQELSQWTAAQSSIAQSLSQLARAKPAAPAALWAQARNTQAQLLLNMGNAQAALEQWEQAEKDYQQAGDRIGQIGTQINQAQALQNLGFYRRAQQQLVDLGQTLIALPDNDVKVTGLQTLGSAWQDSGNSDEAEKSLEKALELARKLGDRSKQSAILLNLEQIASQTNDPETAFDDLAEAEKITRNPLEQGQIAVRRLRLMVDYERDDEAIRLAPQVQRQISALPPSRTALYSAINFAASIQRLDNPSQALPPQVFNQFMATTVKAAQQIQDQTAEAYALNQWAQQYARHQQWDDAARLANRSLTLARQLNAEDIISQSAWQVGLIQRERGDRAGAIRAYEEAVAALQSIRGDLIASNADAQFSFRESVEPVYRQLVDLLLQEASPSQDALKKARGLIEALQVAELDNFFREACLDKAQQIDQIDPTATVVYPILLPDRLAVILSQAGQPLRYYVTQKPKAEIEQTLSKLVTALSPVTDAAARNQTSKQLYDWLIRPAEADQAFKTTKTLVFVLDGKLRDIPMAALYDGQQYLIDKYAITLSPGLQLMSSQALANNAFKAIVGGISESRNGFSALPAVNQEVEKIATVVATSPLLNKAFTNAALSDRVKNDAASVVHLATHGQFSSRLEDTFLLTWDGRMNVKELSELLKTHDGNADKAINLLVLSACDTAAGDDRAVLGLAGLAVKSGARSTIASLWPVKDKAAARLMSEFYEQIKKPGMTKAEALRQAQLTMIHKTDFDHPFFWSAFILVGNWQ
jgi:CHAT domain-containing protein/tetratricopeptide (TPR) repeat protein